MNPRLRISTHYLSALLSILCSTVTSPSTFAAESSFPPTSVTEFLTTHCTACHADGSNEGHFELSELKSELADAAAFARWERVFDRVAAREMPPPEDNHVEKAKRELFQQTLGRHLTDSHTATKGTVLRRLNRREYQNTMNDIFGTRLDLESQLPEDGQAQGFDNVGEALGISMVHLQQYLAAADAVMDAAIEKSSERPPQNTTTASYADTREGKQFIGRFWKQLPDGAVAFFARMGYPSGMLRGTEVRPPGLYRIRITGYAYRSEQPVTIRVGGTSFLRGSDKPTYGYVELPPGEPTTVELQADIRDRYMISIDPWGLHTGDYNLRKDGLDGYTGPGVAISKVELIGPIIEQFPKRGHQLLLQNFQRTALPKNKWAKFEQFELSSENPSEAAAKTYQRVAAAAFRRPVDTAEIARYVKLFEAERSSGASQEEALRTGIAAILCSPDFIFFREPSGQLDPFALATRLSYFVTRSTPDERLLEAAAKDTLHGDDVLLAQLRRLMNDERSERFITDFCDAWLNLRDIEITSPDQQLFPEFDAFLQHSMLQETRSFVRKLMMDNLPIRNVVKSNFAMLNERLAEHYGIKHVHGPAIRPVQLLGGSLRGGLLSQASVLKVSANGTNTSPVVRGVWVMDRLLAKPPQPPPPGIPGIEPDIRGATTLRELLEKHRDLDSCRNCHANIDPPGFALECFNPIGGFRERFRSLGDGDRVDDKVRGRRVRYRLGPAVDNSGTLPDGRTFASFREFRDELAKDEETLAIAFATKLLTFATGREMGFSDRPIIHKIVSNTKSGGNRAWDLLEQVVLSEVFKTK